MKHPRKTPAAAWTLLVMAALSCGHRPSERSAGHSLSAAASSPADSETETDELAPRGESDEVARLFLTGARQPSDVRERTGAYRWFSVGRVYGVYDFNRNRALVVATTGDGTPPVNLSGPSNRTAVANFLARQFGGKFPGLDKIDGVAQLLKDVTIGMHGVIADGQFLESQKWHDGVRAWLGGREKDPKVFEGICTGIEARETENEWRLRFNVFNTAGGVDRLTAVGTRSPLTIQRVSVEAIKRAGEFFSPLEG